MKLNRYLIISYNDIIFLLLEKDLFPSWERLKEEKNMYLSPFCRRSKRHQGLKLIFSKESKGERARENNQDYLFLFLFIKFSTQKSSNPPLFQVKAWFSNFKVYIQWENIKEEPSRESFSCQWDISSSSSDLLRSPFTMSKKEDFHIKSIKEKVSALPSPSLLCLKVYRK